MQRLVREHEAVYGEFPPYEPGYYTFLLDYLPYDGNDGMEHRNSTFITESGVSLKSPQGRQSALDAISHEFFHNWNVERIRPVGLEPFNFTRENVTCCLWLAEGFTQYYGDLLLARARYTPAAQAGAALARYASAVVTGSGRAVRSVVQMSEYAPFADAATSIDPTDRSRTFISYYTYGAAIALGLDLSLREMSNGKLSLDDFMRRLWTEYGKPGGPAPGLVGKPYSLTDLHTDLAQLTGNRQFADDFFSKYISGREVPDYAHLLSLAGYVMRPVAASRAWTGMASMQDANGGLIVGGASGRGGALVPFGTPAYDAGLDAGDVILSIDNGPATTAAWNALAQKKPGDSVKLSVRRRDGATVSLTMTLKPDPSVQIMDSGDAMTAAQKAFRGAWLGTRVN